MKPTIVLCRRLRFVTSLIFLTLCFIITAAASSLADEVDETVESYYQSPAQVAHAAQLAEEAALENTDVQQAWDAFQDAQEALDAQEDPTEEQLAALESLRDAYMSELAAVTGLIGEEIEGMRTSGMGWGEIAHELGVHPSVLGLGPAWGQAMANKEAGFSADEMAEATARNTRNTAARGHGLGLGVGNKGDNASAGPGNSNAGGLGVGNKGGNANAGPGNNNAGGLGGGNKGGNNNAGGLGGGNKGGNANAGPGNSSAGGLGGGNKGGNANAGPGNSSAGGLGGGNKGGNANAGPGNSNAGGLGGGKGGGNNNAGGNGGGNGGGK